MSNEQFNPNLVETSIKLIGDKSTICLITLLLAYVRHAIKNNMQADIKVSVGKKVANGQLLFDVNGFEIPDIITLNLVEIN